ncbi:hypothetical protein DJ66_1098 [Candidatus Liberibacter solanacearum]|uniref:Uncharacterized protein n=1 Tax=Candidatus Liberibacter solanacearum TaxID=556287 RepID=A0A0F4VLG6_9HYPH|nr:hypothetical protein DJ66_1098 [Candidatus Liberibacter solanacearum]
MAIFFLSTLYILKWGKSRGHLSFVVSIVFFQYMPCGYFA